MFQSDPRAGGVAAVRFDLLPPFRPNTICSYDCHRPGGDQKPPPQGAPLTKRPGMGQYRHWQASELRQEEMVVRDAIQRLSARTAGAGSGGR